MTKYRIHSDPVFIEQRHTDARYWYSNSVCLSVCPSFCCVWV